MAISAFCFDFIERLHHAQATDPALVAFHDEIQAGTRTAPWALVDGMVAIEDRLYIPPTSPLLQEILAAVHNDGHEGIHRTLHRLRQDFHFPNMRRLVQDFVKACVTYQQYKSNYLRLAGLLQPLPIPPAIWADIGIDFIEALPKVQRQDGHPLRRGSLQQILPFHPLSAPLHRRVRRARLLRQHRWTTWRPAVHRLEPRSGVHSTFWQELMQLTGTKLYMSTAFHPQTDGQTEAANPASGSGGYHGRSTPTTPPSRLRFATPRSGWSTAGIPRPSARMSPARLAFLRWLRRWRNALLSSRTSAIAWSRHRRSRSVSTTNTIARCPSRSGTGHNCASGSEPRPPCLARPKESSSLATLGRTKYWSSSTQCLCGSSFRPAPVFTMCSTSASSRSSSAPPPAVPPPLPPLLHGAAVPAPARVTQARLARGMRQVLVEWQGEPTAAATWEDFDDFRARFPTFQLEDELDFEGGRDVMCGRTYVRRRRTRDIRRAAERAGRAEIESEPKAATSSG